MKLYRTTSGTVAATAATTTMLPDLDWDWLFTAARAELVAAVAAAGVPVDLAACELLPPVQHQEVWAAGVTYERSRTARMEEARQAGGSDFYDRVYEADRPELFFKATANRVVGDGGCVRVRSDSRWTVPEPELCLAINAHGELLGYSVGNDMSARDIEGENPLYLPQAKVYDACCGVGPGLLLTEAPLPATTEIRLQVRRHGNTVCDDATTLQRLRRSPQTLISYLFRDNAMPFGCWLMTGTGIVPADDFSLCSGDQITITIDGVGCLHNEVS